MTGSKGLIIVIISSLFLSACQNGGGKTSTVDSGTGPAGNFPDLLGSKSDSSGPNNPGLGFQKAQDALNNAANIADDPQTQQTLAQAAQTLDPFVSGYRSLGSLRNISQLDPILSSFYQGSVSACDSADALSSLGYSSLASYFSSLCASTKSSCKLGIGAVPEQLSTGNISNVITASATSGQTGTGTLTINYPDNSGGEGMLLQAWWEGSTPTSGIDTSTSSASIYSSSNGKGTLASSGDSILIKFTPSSDTSYFWLANYGDSSSICKIKINLTFKNRGK